MKESVQQSAEESCGKHHGSQSVQPLPWPRQACSGLLRWSLQLFHEGKLFRCLSQSLLLRCTHGNKAWQHSARLPALGFHLHCQDEVFTVIHAAPGVPSCAAPQQCLYILKRRKCAQGLGVRQDRFWRTGCVLHLTHTNLTYCWTLVSIYLLPACVTSTETKPTNVESWEKRAWEADSLVFSCCAITSHVSVLDKHYTFTTLTTPTHCRDTLDSLDWVLIYGHLSGLLKSVIFFQYS